MEYLSIAPFAEKLSRVALGTWAVGGALWGGTDEEDSIRTILTALDRGINVIDTAPAYGEGLSERLVGKAVAQSKKRSKLLLSTKVGIEFRKDGSAARNLTEKFMLDDFHNSLKRLGTDYIDIYFIHWPDPLVPIEEQARVMKQLYEAGKIRAIGVSNYSPEQCDLFRQVAPCHFCQPPYNLFERNIDAGLLAYCKKNKIALMTYSAICRGLLSGKMDRTRIFKDNDLRKMFDPKFKGEIFEEYLSAAERLKKLAENRYQKTLLEFAIRWVLDQGVEIALWGARRPSQLDPIGNIFGWQIDAETKKEVDTILKECIKHPQDVSTYMGPPVRKG